MTTPTLYACIACAQENKNFRSWIVYRYYHYSMAERTSSRKEAFASEGVTHQQHSQVNNAKRYE
jgi:hypothetical protein